MTADIVNLRKLKLPDVVAARAGLAFEQRQKLMFHGTKALLVSFGVQIAKAWIRRQRVVDRPLLRNFDYVRIQNVAWIV